MKDSILDKYEYSIVKMAKAIRSRKVASADITAGLLSHISRKNPAINAFAVILADQAMERAEALDAMAAENRFVGSLHGIPFTIKECIDVKGLATSLGTKALKTNIATKNATVVDRILNAGGICLGKTTLSEAFADWQCESELFGCTRNPWNLRKTTGGSSGGACAAVASGMSLCDVGSDLGGSVRIPAHFCGVFGLKPTEGRIPLTGQRDRVDSSDPAPILNALGPITRNASDMELIFSVLASSHTSPVRLKQKPLRIAYMPEFPEIGAESDVSAAVTNMARQLAKRGCRVECRRPLLDYEALWSLREHLRDIITGVSQEPLERYAAPRASYIDAWERFFGEYDFFLCPVAARTAWSHCKPYTDPWNKNNSGYPRMFYYTTLFNLTGHPALSVPYGLDRNGLPIGVQVVSALHSDERLLAFARRLETLNTGVSPHEAKENEWTS